MLIVSLEVLHEEVWAREAMVSTAMPECRDGTRLCQALSKPSPAVDTDKTTPEVGARAWDGQKQLSAWTGSAGLQGCSTLRFSST